MSTGQISCAKQKTLTAVVIRDTTITLFQKQIWTIFGVDNAIQRINHSPVDRVVYQFANNRSQITNNITLNTSILVFKRNSNLLTFLEVTRLELANIPANLSVFLLTLLKNKKNKILVSQNLTSLSSYSRVFFYLAIIRLVVREEVVSFALYLFFATKVYLPTFSEIQA